MTGTILQGIGGFYTVMDDAGDTYQLRAQAKIRRERMKPKVGDRVEMTPGMGEEEGWLHSILPHRNDLVRPPVANVDVIVIVAAAATPQPDMMLVDRMILTARRCGIEPMLVVSKCELNPEGARELIHQYRCAQVSAMQVSAHTGENIEALRTALRGKMMCLLCG